MEQNGNTKKEGLYFMRKKWEIEEEYRNFCRNNKELALQTLRELTLTPTETPSFTVHFVWFTHFFSPSTRRE